MNTSHLEEVVKQESGRSDSPLVSSTAFFSLNESSASNTEPRTNTTDFVLNENNDVFLNSKVASINLIESESADNLEVDPKSQLANKTIFKTDNPNLSIIEISNSSPKDDENTVYLIESSDDEIDKNEETEAEKRKRKVENVLHSNKQQKQNSKSVIEVYNSDVHDIPVLVESNKLKNNDVNSTENMGKRSTPRVIQIYNTLEEFEANLPPTVTVLRNQFGSKIYLIGTAHFSEESQDDVSYVIRNVRPDVVMVELCPSRVHILKLDEKTLLEEAKNLNLAKIRSIIGQNGYIYGIFNILLLHMSAQLAKELGMAPGGEFRRAFEEMHRIPGCMMHLGDRPIHITLQRALSALTFWQKMKLVWRLTSTEGISIEEVEECKNRDLLDKLMLEMAGEFPAFSEVFVKERDIYLCHSLQVASLPQMQDNGLPRPVRVVGVVGIGHANGITKNWGRLDTSKMAEILVIPPDSVGTKICRYTIKYGLIGITLFGAYKFARPRLGKFF